MSLDVLVETSARHVHLTKEHVGILFGEGASLTFKRALSQPGEFLSEQRVDVIGEKKTLSNVAVLGPERSATQVELSLTDARSIGVDAPVRLSGDVAGSGSCKITGPCGSIEMSEGVISAKRHIHFTPGDAEAFGVKDKQTVSVAFGGPRAMVMGEVTVRVSPNFKLAMHVDVDEANAAGLSGEVYGAVIL